MPLLKNLTPAPGESWPFGPQYSALRAFSPDLTASTPKPKSYCETPPISQTNDNLQVRKSRDCATCDIGLYAGPDAEYQLNTLSDDDDAIDAIPLSLLCSQEAFFSV